MWLQVIAPSKKIVPATVSTRVPESHESSPIRWPDAFLAMHV